MFVWCQFTNFSLIKLKILGLCVEYSPSSCAGFFSVLQKSTDMHVMLIDLKMRESVLDKVLYQYMG